jgi:hypothetical protein
MGVQVIPLEWEVLPNLGLVPCIYTNNMFSLLSEPIGDFRFSVANAFGGKFIDWI